MHEDKSAQLERRLARLSHAVAWILRHGQFGASQWEDIDALNEVLALRYEILGPEPQRASEDEKP